MANSLGIADLDTGVVTSPDANAGLAWYAGTVARIGDVVYALDLVVGETFIVKIEDGQEISRVRLYYGGEVVTTVYGRNLFSFDGLILFAGSFKTSISQPEDGYQIDVDTGEVTLYLMSTEVVSASVYDIVYVGDGFICSGYGGVNEVSKFSNLTDSLPVWSKTAIDYAGLDNIFAATYDGDKVFIFSYNYRYTEIDSSTGDQIGAIRELTFDGFTPTGGITDASIGGIGQDKRIYEVWDKSSIPYQFLGYSETDGGEPDYLPTGNIEACPAVLDNLSVMSVGRIALGVGETTTDVTSDAFLTGDVHDYTIVIVVGQVNIVLPSLDSFVGDTGRSYTFGQGTEALTTITGLSVTGLSVGAKWEILVDVPA